MVLGLPLGLCLQLTFSTVSGLFEVKAQDPWVNRKGAHRPTARTPMHH